MVDNVIGAVVVERRGGEWVWDDPCGCLVTWGDTIKLSRGVFKYKWVLETHTGTNLYTRNIYVSQVLEFYFNKT